MNMVDTGGRDEQGGAERTLARKLDAAALLARRVEGDRLLLDDATLRSALAGTRPLTAGERAALQTSPLTARRLRHLALERRAETVAHAGAASSDWRASRGMLRAASTGSDALPLALRTDDGCWTLHFVPADGAWQAILQLAPQAPFAGTLLAARAAVRVLDGAGGTLLRGALDLDGECEAAWPHAEAPAAWLQAHGAAFAVEPA
jgi:hypothetical protein